MLISRGWWRYSEGCHRIKNHIHFKNQKCIYCDPGIVFLLVYLIESHCHYLPYVLLPILLIKPIRFFV